ncbi:MAG: M2 family metallopeptidase [Calditrichia bacterium]
MEKKLEDLLSSYEGKIKPLRREANLAYFRASVSGDQNLYKKTEELEITIGKIHADQGTFEELKRIRESGAVQDTLLKRQADVVYNHYLEKQIDPEALAGMIRLQTRIEQRYSTYRAEIEGRPYSDNEIEDILKTEKDSRRLRRAWESSKQVGREVAPMVLELVKMRNEAARKVGFDNFHQMQLKLNDQDPQEIEALFDELDELTRKAFAELKRDMDHKLAAQYGIAPAGLRPWHYQNRFFQEAPKIYEVDLDRYYRDRDVVELTRRYYAGIGLPVDDLIQNSDLYEKEGKYQHAYCTDIDREGDIRVVCNVKPNYNWMNTMLHEYGHAVYDKYNDSELPWTLREPAHTFTTEAVAMLFGRFAANPRWLQDVAGVSPAEAEKIAADCARSTRLEQLVFSRWAQVMYRFEKSMYENPDQDLNRLWWDLVEKYQMLQRPENRNEPDWAAKIHVALYPAYYHNYLMGELLASQLYYTLVKQVLKADSEQPHSFYNRREVGAYLIENVFRPGKKYQWNEMIRRATGEPLTARYYARQFVTES